MNVGTMRGVSFVFRLETQQTTRLVSMNLGRAKPNCAREAALMGDAAVSSLTSFARCSIIAVMITYFCLMKALYTFSKRL